MTEREKLEERLAKANNDGNTLAGNTQGSDLEWFARWLRQSVSSCPGEVGGMRWSIDNEEFEQFGLTPDRAWTDKSWDTLTADERTAWRKLACACLYAMPYIAERIGRRMQKQAEALRVEWRKIYREENP